MAVEQYLSGKVAIVTGSSKLNGIGAASAIELAKHGADVLIHYNSNKAPAEQVVDKIKSFGVKVASVQADAASPDFGQVLVEAALKAFDVRTIDIIVNNAAHGIGHPEVAQVPVDAWDEVFHVNVRAPFLLIQAALPYMKSGGRIVNVSSIVSKIGSKMLAVYGSSKGALNAMSTALAEELGPRNITINVVSPGPITTDMDVSNTPIATRLEANQHLKRFGTAEEVAAVVLFLSSPSSSYITGQNLYVDGGINLP
ncbi:hypothetical protein Plec18167_005028 [Paecilomyces lecythidis]|uniref:Uncharacterized protein n=1 Tax=Paecilomyces lecythidis TaxID=3004212 RepID=A0ABR3XKV8_9EURO